MKNPLTGLRRYGLLGVMLSLWAAGEAVFLLLILRQTGGRFIYSLDDAYIHLAMAKHLAQNGVWGITPYAFSASSSSPFWSLLLAGLFRLFGVQEIFPLILSWLAAAALIVLMYREWAGRGASPVWVFVFFLAWMVFLPLWPILFNGMETMLQALTAVAFSAAAVHYLAEDKPRSPLLLCLLAALASAVRYEGCFIAAVVCLLLVLRRRWTVAALVGASAALPVAAFGVYSVGQGWWFLPNSLLIKYSGVSWGDPASLWNMLARPFQTVVDSWSTHLPLWQTLAVILLLVLLWRAKSGYPGGFWNARLLPAVIFLTAAFLHSMLITVEWFFRYEAYLNILGVWAIGCAAAPWVPRVDWSSLRRRSAPLLSIGCAAVLLAAPILRYAFQANAASAIASRNIWEQQYQMGLFLREYYPVGRVAANDIGAIDYLADIRLVDLYGLASMTVLRAKQSGEWARDETLWIERITAEGQTRIAVVYNTWFNYRPETGASDLPSSWVRVADWTIHGNVASGGVTVTWYAVQPEEAPALRAALLAFAEQLPSGVTVRYFPVA